MAAPVATCSLEGRAVVVNAALVLRCRWPVVLRHLHQSRAVNRPMDRVVQLPRTAARIHAAEANGRSLKNPKKNLLEKERRHR